MTNTLTLPAQVDPATDPVAGFQVVEPTEAQLLAILPHDMSPADIAAWAAHMGGSFADPNDVPVA